MQTSKEMNDRIDELEKKAKDKYIEESDWERVIEMLEEDEQLEYWELISRICPSNKLASKKIEELKEK